MLTVTPRPPCADAGLAGVGSLRRFETDNERREIIMAPRSGPDFAAESGDDRTRTGACSPDKRVLLPLSYVPK